MLQWSHDLAAMESRSVALSWTAPALLQWSHDLAAMERTTWQEAADHLELLQWSHDLAAMESAHAGVVAGANVLASMEP